MIIMLVGHPGMGKTSLMSAWAVKAMRERTGLIDAIKDIETKIEGGFKKLTIPTEHMAYANIDIFADISGEIASNEVNGFHIMLPKEGHPSMHLPPHAQIFLDEAQNYYDSRFSSQIPPEVYNFYEWHRHNNLNITMTVQRPASIDVKIRSLSAIYDIVDLKHEYYFGELTHSTWTYNILNNFTDFEEYQRNAKSISFKQEKFTFEGNIFRHYNSFNKEPAFYKDRYESDFDMIPCRIYGNNLEDFKAFNLRHDYTASETFWKSKGKENEKN